MFLIKHFLDKHIISEIYLHRIIYSIHLSRDCGLDTHARCNRFYNFNRKQDDAKDLTRGTDVHSTITIQDVYVTLTS